MERVSGEWARWKETENIGVGWGGMEKAGLKRAKRRTGVGNQICCGHGMWSEQASHNMGSGTHSIKNQTGWVIAPHCARVESPLRGLL